MLPGVCRLCSSCGRIGSSLWRLLVFSSAHWPSTVTSLSSSMSILYSVANLAQAILAQDILAQGLSFSAVADRLHSQANPVRNDSVPLIPTTRACPFGASVQTLSCAFFIMRCTQNLLFWRCLVQQDIEWFRRPSLREAH